MSRLRLVPTLALIVILSVIWVAGPVAAGTGTPVVPEWVSRYNGPGNGADSARAEAVSPDGSRVFVTGSSLGATSSTDYATAAYDAGTGATRWLRRYNGPGNAADFSLAVAVSPNGAQVFVTGQSAGSSSDYDYATVAYDAVTGATQWLTRYNGPGNATDAASDITVSPDGSRVFITGESTGSSGESDYATVAYASASGAEQWLKRYDGPGHGHDQATALSVSPDGSEVFATGGSSGSAGDYDYATVAYDSTTGAKRWAKRFHGPGTSGYGATALAVSPDGSRLFVTGNGRGYATVAYDAGTGAQMWVALYKPFGGGSFPLSLAVSPDGSHVFVTGSAYSVAGSSDSDDYATVAYDAASGAEQWHKGFNGWYNERDVAYALAVSPDGATVFVTGRALTRSASDDYVTLAYDSATGEVQWKSRYDGTANGSDGASDVAVSPDGTQVFVTGSSSGGASLDDYATVAYGA